MSKFRMNPETGVLERILDEASIPVVQPKSDDNDKVSVEDVVKKPDVAAQVIDPNEGIYQFREESDLTRYVISDNDTGEELAVISGYALDFHFNTKKLNSTKRVEMCLDGITKLFRRLIIDKVLNNPKDAHL